MIKRVTRQDNWPESWKYSYPYDLLEVYGDTSCRGYAYAYANRSQHILHLVQKVAQPGAKVLDVAAAQGNFTLSLCIGDFHNFKHQRFISIASLGHSINCIQEAV